LIQGKVQCDGNRLFEQAVTTLQNKKFWFRIPNLKYLEGCASNLREVLGKNMVFDKGFDFWKDSFKFSHFLEI